VLLELYSIINLRGIVLIAIVIAILIKGLYDVKKAEKAEEELKIK
jgi:glycopeptide antibiotics resistance protein